MEVDLTIADGDFAGREKDGFIGNSQYIANRRSTAEMEAEFNPPKVRYSDSTCSRLKRHLWTILSLHTVFALTPIHLPLFLRSPRVIAGIAAGTVTVIGITAYAMTRRKPTAEELERERRELLARSGRITDGTIMDTMITEARTAAVVSVPEVSPQAENPATPQIIVYNYRIAGVTYECAQDVTALAEYVHGIRTDLPVQVRYLPQNPANSIIVAESWSGLRLNSSRPYQAD